MHASVLNALHVGDVISQSLREFFFSKVLSSSYKKKINKEANKNKTKLPRLAANLQLAKILHNKIRK